MDSRSTDTDQLVTRAVEGDSAAMYELLDRHRERLRRMVAIRMDRRLAVRMDPSDVVQEALAKAANELPDYAKQRHVSFYPWLRSIAWQQLASAYRRHVQAARRSVLRERVVEPKLPDESVAELSGCIAVPGPSPSGMMINAEMQRRVRAALGRMRQHDREILVLRYLEQLSMQEIGETVGVSEAAARKRHARALERLEAALSDLSKD